MFSVDFVPVFETIYLGLHYVVFIIFISQQCCHLVCIWLYCHVDSAATCSPVYGAVA